VDWDALKINGKTSTYKELRSLVRNNKLSLQEAQNVVVKHFQKTLGDTSFVHRENQKEEAIQMD
jgi:hypothetical protein